MERSGSVHSSVVPPVIRREWWLGRSGREKNSRPAGKPPSVRSVGANRARPAVARIIARPDHLPAFSGRRRQEGLRGGPRIEVRSEVHDQEPIIPFLPKEAQREGLGSQDRPINRLS